MLWQGAALVVNHTMTAIAAVVLFTYPARDAIASLVDTQRNEGIRRNPTQAFNTAVSTVTTIARCICAGPERDRRARRFRHLGLADEFAPAGYRSSALEEQ